MKHVLTGSRIAARVAARCAFRRLSKLPNVMLIAIGRKRRGGKILRKHAVIVYVKNKERIPRRYLVPLRLPVPLRANDVETDVQQLPAPPEVFGVRSGHIVRAADMDLGVVGLVFSKSGRDYALTNAHVACDVSQGGRAGYMQFLERSSSAYRPLGPVVFATPLNPNLLATSDLAIIGVDHYQIDPWMVLDVPMPTQRGVIRPGNGEYWYSVGGKVFICGFPEQVVKHVDIRVDGTVIKYARFWQLRMRSDSPSAPGQSGALLCQSIANGILACGMVFGGSQPGYIFAFSFETFFDRAWAALP